MRKEISLTQQTLTAASAMIDDINWQQYRTQATPVKLEETVSNGCNKVIREIGMQGGRYPLQYFENAWPNSFFTHHGLSGKNDVPAVDTVNRSWGGIEENPMFFRELFDGLEPFYEVDEVRRYCEGGASLKEVHDGAGDAGTRRAAWIDDRNSPDLTGKGSARLVENPLTATGLLRYLKRPVWTLPDFLLFSVRPATHIVIAIPKWQ
jgi:hypothetical protein